MPNRLTTQAGLKLGPIVLETFFKHYLDRIATQRGNRPGPSNNLRRDELLWQEAFEIVKSFLNSATSHTVEELQEFSNARIPSPPWTWVSQVLVPMSCCDVAATHLIKALGGEDVANRVVGGTKWWQVRGICGVDCQWICQKSQMQKRKKEKSEGNNDKDTMRSSSNPAFPPTRTLSNNIADLPPDATPRHPINEIRSIHKDKEINITDMDGTRCMLYVHGGGYYFGSIDQERYCMQRYARKIKGRVFACNYRLSPQYPFPCAIQDLLAAYLYLIEPPPEALHAPIPPNSIVLGGDSAGGGLCLAALQVMRDSGVPLPAAAVLISPWSDLTHSFPSIIDNTATDIIPPYGLSLHKPSVLWPPPPDEISSKVRASLRARFQEVVKKAVRLGAVPINSGPSEPAIISQVQPLSAEAEIGGTQTYENYSGRDKDASPQSILTAPVIIGPEESSTPRNGKLPLPWESSESIHLHVDGKSVTINTQIQLYCPNSLLIHPLVSPALGYLGGLPPLLIIASDKEVLRDEIIYVAHKAAYPDRFPTNEGLKQLYPSLQGIEAKHAPTSVHLQVYDETAHVLPLFSFTTPAKYCYRAIALFTQHFTILTDPSELITPMAPQAMTPDSGSSPSMTFSEPRGSPSPSDPDSPKKSSNSHEKESSFSVSRSHSFFAKRTTMGFKHRSVSEGTSKVAETKDPVISTANSGDVAGNRFQSNEANRRGPGTAGDPSVYSKLKTSQGMPLGDIMIRERVSTHGIVRLLEPESELGALQLQPDQIGVIKERAARRYLEGLAIWTKKFSKTAARIEAKRLKNLELAKGETIHSVKAIGQVQQHFLHDTGESLSHTRYPQKRRSSAFHLHPLRQHTSREEGLPSSDRYTWGWVWALDGEHPPPSSIVSRRDTVEARNLARVADLSVDQEESKMSGNMLWSILVDFLTSKPHNDHQGDDEDDAGGDQTQGQREEKDKRVRKASSGIFHRIKSLRAKREPSSAVNMS